MCSDASCPGPLSPPSPPPFPPSSSSSLVLVLVPFHLQVMQATYLSTYPAPRIQRCSLAVLPPWLIRGYSTLCSLRARLPCPPSSPLPPAPSLPLPPSASRPSVAARPPAPPRGCSICMPRQPEFSHAGCRTLRHAAAPPAPEGSAPASTAAAGRGWRGGP